MENQFTYFGTTVRAGYGKRELPYIILPDQSSGLNRRISISELTIGFKGKMTASVVDQLLNQSDEVVPRATLSPKKVTMPTEDYDYFYDIQVNGQGYGDFTEKQLINNLLKQSLNLNCYNHLGEFLAPITFSESHTEDSITISVIDHDDSLDKEYSIDNGENWQDSNEFTALEYGTYNLSVRYKNKELREGSSFRSIQETVVTLVDPNVVEEEV